MNRGSLVVDGMRAQELAAAKAAVGIWSQRSASQTGFSLPLVRNSFSSVFSSEFPETPARRVAPWETFARFSACSRDFSVASVRSRTLLVVSPWKADSATTPTYQRLVSCTLHCPFPNALELHAKT